MIYASCVKMRSYASAGMAKCTISLVDLKLEASVSRQYYLESIRTTFCSRPSKRAFMHEPPKR
jgi:hypothetical protein